MENSLYFEEWTIKNIGDDEDKFGTKTKYASITSHDGRIGTAVLYPKDIALLEIIFGCSVNDLKGKNITAVIKENTIYAIGYQGLYVPLYYRDGSSKILSESQLCELLECYNVIRNDRDGNQILSYEVPAKGTAIRGR